MTTPTTRDAIAAKTRELLALRVDRDGRPLTTPTDPEPVDPAPAESTGPRTPAPDPSQGARGGLPEVKTNAQLIREIRHRAGRI